MKLPEITFLYFDNCIINHSKPRTIIPVIESLQKHSKLPIVFNMKIRISKNDCEKTLRFLKSALAERKKMYERDQVLIILYDLPFIEEGIKVVRSARNQISLTSDLDGLSLKQQKIDENLDESQFLVSPLESIGNEENLEFRDSRSLYIDNFVYFRALRELDDVQTVLLHVSYNLCEEQIIELYEKILKVFYKDD